MGIDGLLKHLKQCMQEKNLEEYRGQKAAVDTYAWLHKIIKGQCGKEIITGKDPIKYVNDCIRRAEKITKAGIDLILVFDGGVLPRKLNEEETRRRRREQNFEKGKELIEKGNMDQGVKRMIDAIDVSPDVAYKLIEELKIRNYKFIVAPYEADAQLAYLSRVGIVDIIITEDSDLLAFGARKILYKLDFTTLNGEQICLENIKEDKTAGFNWFTHNMFLTTCIMAGCDYLDQIKGVGMKLAQKVISKNVTLKKALAELSQSKQIPQSYQQNFMKALLTFRFQRVYCPIRKQCVSVNDMNLHKMNEMRTNVPEGDLWWKEVVDAAMIQYAMKLPENEEHPDWQFLGKKLPKEIAVNVAEGKINPINFGDYDENCLQKLRYKKELNMPDQRRSNTAPASSASNILKYCRPIQRKNPLEYKSIKSRSINEDEYTVFSSNKDPKSQKPAFPSAIEGKKKSLRFNDNSDEESSSEKDAISVQNQSINLLSSDRMNDSCSDENQEQNNCDMDEDIQGEMEEEIPRQEEREELEVQASCFRQRMQEIAETFFCKHFSDELLYAPFSYW